MGNIQIKNLPDDLHRRLRERAASEHLSMRDYVLRLLEEDLARPTTAEWLDDLAQDEPVELRQSPAEAVRAARAERGEEIEAGLDSADRGRDWAG